AAPFLCTYMFLEPSAGAGFQPVFDALSRAQLQAALRADPELPRPVFAALQDIDIGAFIREGRVYGGALYKMEPRELGRLSGEPILEAIGGCKQARQGM